MDDIQHINRELRQIQADLVNADRRMKRIEVRFTDVVERLEALEGGETAGQTAFPAPGGPSHVVTPSPEPQHNLVEERQRVFCSCGWRYLGQHWVSASLKHLQPHLFDG